MTSKKHDKINIRKIGNRTFYRFSGRFDVIEEGNVTYFRDVLRLVSAIEKSAHPIQTGLRWLRHDGQPLEMPENMLDKAWKDYLVLVEDQDTLKEFKEMMESNND